MVSPRGIRGPKTFRSRAAAYPYAGVRRDSGGPRGIGRRRRAQRAIFRTGRPQAPPGAYILIIRLELKSTRSMKQVGWPKTDHRETFNWARDWLARRLERSALAASAREVSVQRRSARSAAVGLRYDLRRPCARAATRAARCSRSLLSKSFSDSRLSASRSSTAGGGGGGALRGSAHGSSSATLG